MFPRSFRGNFIESAAGARFVGLYVESGGILYHLFHLQFHSPNQPAFIKTLNWPEHPSTGISEEYMLAVEIQDAACMEDQALAFPRLQAHSLYGRFNTMLPVIHFLSLWAWMPKKNCCLLCWRVAAFCEDFTMLLIPHHHLLDQPPWTVLYQDPNFFDFSCSCTWTYERELHSLHKKKQTPNPIPCYWIVGESYNWAIIMLLYVYLIIPPKKTIRYDFKREIN